MKAKVKEKTCRNKNCGRKFKPFNSIQVACSKTCAIEMQKVHCVIKRRVDIIPLKPTDGVGSMKKQLQILINRLVLLIDKGLNCTSCPKDQTPQAGHFHSVGAAPHLRYNLNNIHIQGHKCNIELSGNKEGYFKGLCNRYGHGYACLISEILPSRFRSVKLSKLELSEAIKQTKLCIKEMQERLTPIENDNERLKLRQIYNARIGIYK